MLYGIVSLIWELLNKLSLEIHLHMFMCKDFCENPHLHFLSSASALPEVECPLLVTFCLLFVVDLCGNKLVLSIALLLRLDWVYSCLCEVLTLKLAELGVLDLYCLVQGLQLICVIVILTS